MWIYCAAPTWALIILLVLGVKYHRCHLHTSKSLSVDSVSVWLATSHITIDWKNDRTISYLMLRCTRGDGMGERMGEKKRENLISGGLVLYTVHAQ